MSAVLCLDVGMRRVGVAVSDAAGITAQPLEVIDRKDTDPFAAIAALIEARDVEIVVVGLPLALDGTEGPAVRRTRRFVEDLCARVGDVTVVEWDERMSTVAAERAMLEGDVSRARRKESVDSVAASLILQSYLGSRAP